MSILQSKFRLTRDGLVFLIAFLLCLHSGCNEDDPGFQPNVPEGSIVWAKSFGGSADESARSIINTSDGGFAVFGFTSSMDGDVTDKTSIENDYWLLKFDAEGELEWNKTYGGSADDRGQAAIQTRDGGYAITGYAMSDDGDASLNRGFHDNWVLKLDAGGNILWERSFGFSGHDHSYDIIETDDGALLFIGFLDLTAARADGYEAKGVNLSRHGVGEFWCSKISANGELLWQSYFGGTNNDRAHAVTPSPDGGFVLAGFTESTDFDISDPRGSYDFWVIKLTTDGSLVWEKNLGGSGIEIASDITAAPLGGYLVTGHSFSSDGDVSQNSGEADIWVVKLSETGELLWENSFGGSAFDAAESISPTRDGGFLISGTSRSSDSNLINEGENDLIALKIDGFGNLLWQYTFGGSGVDLGFDLIESRDGSLLLTGELGPPGSPELDALGMSDLILMKIH